MKIFSTDSALFVLIMPTLKTLFLILLLSARPAWAQLKTKRVVIVTLDGFRTQELFSGADPALLLRKKFVQDDRVVKKFGALNEEDRRVKLMPFMWNTIALDGQIYGNRKYGNKMNVKNPYKRSYPGYSELFLGYVDKRLRTNRSIENPNANVLEFIGQQAGFENQVVAFATWNIIPSVLRESTSGLPVYAAEEISGDSLMEQHLLTTAAKEISFEGGQQMDVMTYQYALEYVQRERPRVVLISFDGTDGHAHGGHYDAYLNSAHVTDVLLKNLWEWVQSQPDYKDQTTMIVTTDHGRGKGHHGKWRKHGRFVRGSGHTWLAVIGPDTKPLGELKTRDQHYQRQLAATVAALLGLTYKNTRPVGEVMDAVK